ncbi:hypothetical protein LAD77_01410 [Klebsiella pneumoniae]|nr:hypothetical protein [Klebsiella pneumoniae]
MLRGELKKESGSAEPQVELGPQRPQLREGLLDQVWRIRKAIIYFGSVFSLFVG